MESKLKNHLNKQRYKEVAVYLLGAALWVLLYDAVSALGHLFALVSISLLIFVANVFIQKTKVHVRSKKSDKIYHQAIEGAQAILWEWDTMKWDALKIVYDGTNLQNNNQIHLNDVQILRKHLEQCLTGKSNSFECEHRARDEKGGFRWFISRGQTIFHENLTVSKVVGMSFDITARRVEEVKLHEMALRDNLTGLLNRVAFSKKIVDVINTNETTQKKAALLFLDLDDFKTVNDTWGHDVGDAFLKETAVRLKNCVREKDSVVRIGGDEFAILIDDISELDEIERILMRIQEAFEKPYVISDQIISTTISTGVAILPDDGKTVEALMKCADMDMYRLKRTRKKTQELIEQGGINE